MSKIKDIQRVLELIAEKSDAQASKSTPIKQSTHQSLQRTPQSFELPSLSNKIFF